MRTIAFPCLLCIGAAAVSGCIVININPAAKPSENAPESKPVVRQRFDGKPQPFNVDFGTWKPGPSEQSGPAAVGRKGDFWNVVGVPWNHAHTESGLKFANGQPSPIRVEMINLGGGWSTGGRVAIDSPMLDNYNYPANNRGGHAKVILHDVPAGTYALYLYSPCYDDYSVRAGGRDYGTKMTSEKNDAMENKEWVEGSQYVKFAAVKVAPGENIEIVIGPSEEVEHLDQVYRDAMIAGMQLVPAS